MLIIDELDSLLAFNNCFRAGIHGWECMFAAFLRWYHVVYKLIRWCHILRSFSVYRCYNTLSLSLFFAHTHSIACLFLYLAKRITSLLESYVQEWNQEHTLYFFHLLLLEWVFMLKYIVNSYLLKILLRRGKPLRLSVVSSLSRTESFRSWCA